MTRFHSLDRRILFVDRDNGCLSLMAEAIAKKLLPPKTRIFSVRVKQDDIDPRARQVLREIDVAIPSEGREAVVTPLGDVDLVVMLGDRGEGRPAVFPDARRRSTWKISDPSREPGADLDAFRRVRDEINA